LISWGFTADPEGIVEVDPGLYNKHWWLKHFFKRNSHRVDSMPSVSDFEQIQRIRQVSFKKGWKWVFEEWEFADRDAAERWLQLIVLNHDMDGQKPPREFWMINNRIYFLMATAAKDWFEHGEDLVRIMTGRKRGLIRLLFNPFVLEKFKKRKGGSNSSTSGKSIEWYEPEYEGFYYYYLLFNTPRRLPETVRFRDFRLYVYKLGKDPGFYEDRNEILIGVESKFRDPDLRRLDLVETTIQVINEYLGSPQYEMDGLWVYNYGERWLLLEHDEKEITGMHYHIMSGDFNGDKKDQIRSLMML